MTATVYRLKEDGERMKSCTTYVRVTKIEEFDLEVGEHWHKGIRLHTYWSDKGFCDPDVIDADLCDVEVCI